MEVNTESAKAIDNWSTIWLSYLTPSNIGKVNEICTWEGCLHPYVYSSTIHNSRQGNNQMPTETEMDKEAMIPFSRKGQLSPGSSTYLNCSTILHTSWHLRQIRAESEQTCIRQGNVTELRQRTWERGSWSGCLLSYYQCVQTALAEKRDFVFMQHK